MGVVSHFPFTIHPRMRYWPLKSEPSTYSVDDLARDKTTAWSGVRNYQARNFIRDAGAQARQPASHHAGYRRRVGLHHQARKW